MKPTANIPVGAAAENLITVTRDMTVAHFHDEMPEVFGTPIMIYHMEVTASDAIQRLLPEGWVSVGVVVNVRHLAATPVGMKVTLKAQVVEVADHTITFSVEAYDEVEKIGEGIHVRAPVEMSRFMNRMEKKTTGR
ncbi:MAG TPA: hotdog domain-containing protein [Blastocatellia bacterium]|nr:hotdog domain-containing protein [Blastocatellia bacterium]